VLANNNPRYLFFPKRIIDFLPERPYSSNGVKVYLRKNSDDIFLFTPEQEQDVENALILHENETFVDVGANIDRYSLKIAHDYKDKLANIIAIEAHPETYHALCKNIGCNKFKNVHAVNKVVSDHTGLVSLYEDRSFERVAGGNHLHHGHSSICNVFDEKSSLEVQCDTLDNILMDTKVDVMKMDIEGAEVQALKGATNTLKQLRKIVVEIHGDNFEQVKHVLEKSNFTLQIIGRTRSYDDKRWGIGHIIGSKEIKDKKTTI
jgi:FkbM family methyltransferase